VVALSCCAGPQPCSGKLTRPAPALGLVGPVLLPDPSELAACWPCGAGLWPWLLAPGAALAPPERVNPKRYVNPSPAARTAERKKPQSAIDQMPGAAVRDVNGRQGSPPAPRREQVEGRPGRARSACASRHGDLRAIGAVRRPPKARVIRAQAPVYHCIGRALLKKRKVVGEDGSTHAELVFIRPIEHIATSVAALWNKGSSAAGPATT